MKRRVTAMLVAVVLGGGLPVMAIDWSAGDPPFHGERGPGGPGDHKGPPPPGYEGRGDKGPDGDKRGGPRPLTDAELDQAMDVMRQVDPEAASRLEPLLVERREEVAAELQHKFPRMGWFLRLKERDPEMYQLRVDDLRLSREQWVLGKQLREAKAAEEKHEPTKGDIDAIDEKLEQVLAAHFDVRQKIRERELAGLEAQIERLREELEKRADERDELIEKRKEELTEKDAKPGW